MSERKFNTEQVEFLSRQIYNQIGPWASIYSWDEYPDGQKIVYREIAVGILNKDPLHKISDYIKREGGVLQLSYEGSDQKFLASCMFGKEAPDSNMYAGHSIQFGETASEAITKVAEEMNL